MQYGNALHRFLREILLADPRHGTVYMLKLDISDGFYRINLAPADVPKLGVVFPPVANQPPLVALPLVLPMGWKNSPPVFSAATETAADSANTIINSSTTLPVHNLEIHAAALDDTSLSSPAPVLGPAPIPAPTRSSAPSPVPTAAPSNPSLAPTAPPTRDPSLPTQPKPAGYVDVFVDDFISLCQPATAPTVRRALLHAVDSVFRPTDFHDDIRRREPVSLKKLRKGDVSWNTIKVVLGWVVNTATMTIELPLHRQERLGEILASIPPTQRRLSKKKWHKVLGELRSMSIALPGARGLFSAMQVALSNSPSSNRINLSKGVHQALDDFRWLYNDIANRPTRIAEVVPLLPSALGYHDASGEGAGGVWFPTPDLSTRNNGTPAQPILWRHQWPDHIKCQLVTENNPKGTISINDLELAGGLMHLDILAQHLDIRERTVLSKTDNLAALFWQRKGSTTTTKAPSHLLRLFGMHQRFHRYVPRHDYQPGATNPMADDASRLFHLADTAFLSFFNSNHTQKQHWKHVQPLSQLTSAVTSALLQKTCNVESLLVAPPQATPSGTSGSSTHLTWASTPFSRPSKTKFLSSKSSSDESDLENYQPKAVKSSLDQLKITYGQLPRRTSPWGPMIRGPTAMVR